MTLQEVYDKVKTHLLTQRAKSLGSDGCAYRGRNGMMCAVGCLIPDDRYSPQLEGKSATAYSLLQAIPDLPNNIEVPIMLGALQRIHDHFQVDEWESLLKTTAMHYGLNP